MSSGVVTEEIFANTLLKATSQLADSDFNREQLVEAASSILSDILERREAQQNSSNAKSVFQSNKVPKISLRSYLQRIASYTKCSDSCFILALIYLDRITEKRDAFAINSFNIHRLILISVTVAAKFADEQFYTNKWYSDVGGISIDEFNVLEREYLVNLIQFELFVCEDDCTKYHQMVQRYYIENPKISLEKKKCL